MKEFNEVDIKQKIANNYASWKNADLIGKNDEETIVKLCNFIDTFNVRPFVKRDLKRYIKKHSYWATSGLLTGQTAEEFKEMTEMSEQLEMALK